MQQQQRRGGQLGLGGEDGEEEDELLGSDEDEEGGGRGGKYGSGGSSRPLGAGRKLTFEDLQAQFGLGLKEAAANLGICATTLKRACRRNGITRWPRWVEDGTGVVGLFEEKNTKKIIKQLWGC